MLEELSCEEGALVLSWLGVELGTIEDGLLDDVLLHADNKSATKKVKLKITFLFFICYVPARIYFTTFSQARQRNINIQRIILEQEVNIA